MPLVWSEDHFPGVTFPTMWLPGAELRSPGSSDLCPLDIQVLSEFAHCELAAQAQSWEFVLTPSAPWTVAWY